MSVVEALKRRAGLLAAGFLSFLAVLALMRWSGGEPLLQPSADLGLVIGFIFVAAFFVMNDTHGRRGGRAR
ncbi:MAG: hypothetical protein ABR878_05725 [Roseiarcus sp.]